MQMQHSTGRATLHEERKLQLELSLMSSNYQDIRGHAGHQLKSEDTQSTVVEPEEKKKKTQEGDALDWTY